jgi:hypothetical protein
LLQATTTTTTTTTLLPELPYVCPSFLSKMFSFCLLPSWFSPSEPPNPADNSRGTSIAMSSIMPTQEEVKSWGKNKLFEFIKGRPQLIEDDDDLENFKAAKISGKLFLDLAGDLQFFKNECHLPVGPSKELANLASEIKGEVKEGKLLSFIPYSKH